MQSHVGSAAKVAILHRKYPSDSNQSVHVPTTLNMQHVHLSNARLFRRITKSCIGVKSFLSFIHGHVAYSGTEQRTRPTDRCVKLSQLLGLM